jgi:hypothetical protein
MAFSPLSPSHLPGLTVEESGPETPEAAFRNHGSDIDVLLTSS